MSDKLHPTLVWLDPFERHWCEATVHVRREGRTYVLRCVAPPGHGADGHEWEKTSQYDLLKSSEP